MVGCSLKLPWYLTIVYVVRLNARMNERVVEALTHCGEVQISFSFKVI